MSEEHFGTFLVRQQVISEKTLLEALEIQRRHTLTVGQIALQTRLMQAEQVARVLEEQELRPGLRFLELAQELGYMTPQHMRHILDMRARLFPKIGDTLVAMRRLDETTRDRMLGRFRDWLTQEAMPLAESIAAEQTPAPLPPLLNGVVICGEDGSVLSFNAGAEKIYGFAAEEMYHQPVSRLFPLQSRWNVQELFERYNEDNLATAEERGWEVATLNRERHAITIFVKASLAPTRLQNWYIFHLQHLSNKTPPLKPT
jgi:PAS domain S-box-containing protein